MKTFYFTILAGILITGCNNSSTNGNATSPDSSTINSNLNNDKRNNLSGCYLRVIKRDTLALHLEENDGRISGKLSFDNFEKDGSTGSVQGKVEKDVLKLIYDFQSEGMHSVMDIYFKITDNGLIQGIGEITNRGDTALYANPDKIDFPSGNELLKTSCDELDPKYK